MTDELPDWLPDLLLFHGDWSAYVEEVYQVFRQDFFIDCVRFRGRRVSVRREPLDQGKETGFWHAISEGKEEEERTPDLRRCERIRWIRALLEADTAKVRIWKNRRGSDRRIVVALPDFSYVVVLADRGKYVLFITAYHVERERRRQKLRKEWEACNQPWKG